MTGAIMMIRVLTRQPLKLSPLLALAVFTLAPCGAWASPASDEADIANSLARQGCYDTAVMFYEKALRLNPGLGDVEEELRRLRGEA